MDDPLQRAGGWRLLDNTISEKGFCALNARTRPARVSCQRALWTFALLCSALVTGKVRAEVLPQTPAKPVDERPRVGRPPSFDAPTRRSLHALFLETTPDSFGWGSSLGYRLRLPRGHQLGLTLGSAYQRRAFFAGFERKNAWIARASVDTVLPVWRSGDLVFSLDVKGGLRRGFGAKNPDNAAPVDGPNTAPNSNWAVEGSLGFFGHLKVLPRLVLRIGVSSPFSVEVDPEVVSDVTGALLHAGLRTRVSQRVWLYADLSGGGVFGADGDAGKFYAAGLLGFRVVLGKNTEDSPVTNWEVF